MLNHRNRASSRTPETEPSAALRLLNKPRLLTQAGMVAERSCKAFWPLWTSLATGFGLAVFLAPLELPSETLWAFIVLLLVATIFSLFYAARRFRWPTRADAEARLDQSLPGRPIETLGDMQAIGSSDAQSRDVWRAHLRRIAERAKGALPVWPKIRIAERDPFALRYVATLILAVAVLFGGVARVSQIADAATPGGAAIATGPAWEGWIEPPLYTAKPSLYLNDLSAENVSIPEGSRLTLRLYAPDGGLSVMETLSGAAQTESSSDPVQEIVASQSGVLTVDGDGGRTWTIDVVADEAPKVRVDGPASRSAVGEMTLPFSTQDDFAVVAGDAVIELDLASVERRHGLSVEPEIRDAVSIPLPMTITGDRSDFSEDLIDDFSQHPWANLPVTVEMTVEDDLAQTGISESYPMVLPGRRFFDPMAKAVVEQRRDLLWSRQNGRRANQILRAVSHRPEGFISNDKAYLILTTALSRLDVALETGISEEVRDEVAEMLWQAAVQFEDGDLADAAERLRRAQDRLSEAMRDGASDEEIAELMRELREAMQDYMQQLAEQMQRDQQNGQQQAENQPTQEITGDQLQEMLDRLQELMEQGRMDEAQALLDQLMQMMQNMQMAQNQPGQGQGDQSMEGLQQTLRDQQGLADESFQNLQQQQNGQNPGQQPGEQPGQQPGQGQQSGPSGQPGQDGQQGQGGQGQPDANSLAQRQQDLRDLLGRQSQNLPGAGTEAGEAARDSLDRAGRSMDDAADALEEGDLAEALDNQSEAMDELREGMRNLGEALAEMQQGQPGSEQGQASTGNPEAQRDPLGRQAGSVGRLGTDENLLQGEDRYRRARELLDEIRRRSGEQMRPDIELDYLKRLLDRF